MELDHYLYSTAAARQIDEDAATGLAPGTLMARAGAAAFEYARARWPRTQCWLIFVGPGNNGGDGYVMARLAADAGIEVRLYVLGDHAQLPPDAALAKKALEKSNTYAHVQLVVWEQGMTIIGAAARAGPDADATLIVDALFGSGATRVLEGEAAQVVEAINATQLPVFAVDMPSGIHADTGAALGAAVRATVTMSMIVHKAGIFTGQGLRCRGEPVINDLAVNHERILRVTAKASILIQTDLTCLLTPRDAFGHKGMNGRVLVIGGGPAMAGAVRLAGEAALRVGAGLVVVATHPVHAACFSAACPELIAHGVESARDVHPLIEHADVIAIGPGLGQGAWAREMMAAVLEHDKALVIDADGLNLLATEPMTRANWILTPHPGEAAHLLNMETAAIEADRYQAVQALEAAYGGVAVLKGPGTLIASREDKTDSTQTETSLWVASTGNGMLATAGTGDVLTGLIAALAAHNIAAGQASLSRAARAGVLIHGACADRLRALRGTRGLIASDLFGSLPEVLGSVQDHKCRD